MSGLSSLMGRRHRLASSAWVGAIGIFLPAAAADAQTTSPAPGGVETVAQAPVSSTPAQRLPKLR